MTEILSPTLSRTLEALEVRLSRLEYLLSQGDETHTGSADSQRLPPPDATVSTRIANTEIRFSALISRFSAYGDILRLSMSDILSACLALMHAQPRLILSCLMETALKTNAH